MTRIAFALAATIAALAGCAANETRPPVIQPVAHVPETTAASLDPDAPTATEPCDLVCQGAQLVTRPLIENMRAASAIANANAVFAAMHDDLLACYRARLRTNPDAHGVLILDVRVGPDGRVSGIDPNDGAQLGTAAVTCMTERIRRAQFEPQVRGGTLDFRVPVLVQRLAPDTT